ncbi:MAG: hypothetical protein QM426_04530 [Euryarchaeota archaeon]|nr:hypothetical protein [Euryarchaeota archaeon]
MSRALYIAPERAVSASEEQRNPEIKIYSHQGHDSVTSLMHYQSLSFTDYKLRDIKERLTERGILQQHGIIKYGMQQDCQ